mgnify:CR=1 FL=1
MHPVKRISHRTSIRVRYADTDQMQIVYNGKYLEYFEVARTELLRSLGLAYAEFERMGTRLPLIEAHCTYHLPARYDDVLTIEASVEQYQGARLRIDYAIFQNGGDTLITGGYTVHVFQEIPSGRVIRPPKIFLETMERGLATQ